ncbi:MAG: DNA polymerase I [Bacteroidetes bacterium]|nr:DNA polymerase I [Bacteroidota bacterium]MDA0943761.1 DNA polymerase I [Bacteroidota bacterium]MDA1111442.1 DNA polymerase I [Bacteroidota bacterium]
MEPAPKLFLLDGMALIYRAFFAFSQNPRITSKGLNASAMFGFTNTLLEVLRKQGPSHLAVVFDTDKPTARHIEFEAYKAQREAMPEDLRKSIPYIFQIIEGFNIPVITKDGYEADDIIGTLAWQAHDQGYQVYMMTPDKDFAQLVRDGVYIYKPGRAGIGDEILGVPEVLAKWEIERVDQVIDILGLWGDAVDNIPGVPGVGEKTAKKLIADWGSVDNIIANAASLKGKLAEKFVEFADQARLSKRLATIDTAVPLDLTPADLALGEWNKEALMEVFAELEFRGLTQRVLGMDAPMMESTEVPKRPASNPNQTDLFGFEEETPTPVYQTLSDLEHRYVTVNSPETWAELQQCFESHSEFCFDTETSGVDALTADLVGLSFCFKEGEAYYIPVAQNTQTLELFAAPVAGSEKGLSATETLSKLQPYFVSNALKIAQNLKYDWAVLNKHGCQLKGPYFDTMLAHYVLEPDKRHNMQVLSEHYLGYTPISIETLIGKKGKNQGTMADVPLEQIAEYAAEDGDVTYRLYGKLKSELAERGLESVLNDIELPLVSVLAEMEAEGVRVDTAFLRDYSQLLTTQAIALQDKIHGHAGQSFNVSSPQQVGALLFDHLKLSDKPKKTKTGQYQTDEETLLSLAGKHEVVQQILDFRALQKLKSTYVDAIPQLVNAKTGRVHTHFNQAVAATGRLSSQNPNLQNIPIRTELGREIRKAFVARDPQHVLLSADYSQIELRVIAHISGDQGMKEAFIAGHDIHTATAAKVWGVEIGEVDSDMRRKAKTVNFGIIYGISAFGLSQRVGISRSEAKEIIDQYFIQFPGIKSYMDSTIEGARSKGYVETILGRRRYVPDVNSRNATVRGFAERNAINAPIQGSAADMIKLAMVRIQDWLKAEQLDTRMTLQVHDELLFDVPQHELEVVREPIVNLMQNALPLSIPVLVESGVGNNWLEAH